MSLRGGVEVEVEGEGVEVEVAAINKGGWER